jgi:hypothetical protein
MTRLAASSGLGNFVAATKVLSLCAGLLLLGTVGCEPAERLDVEPYCDYQNDYEVNVLYPFERVGLANTFYCFADEVGSSYPHDLPIPAKTGQNDCPRALVEPIEGGAYCPPEPPPSGVGDPLTHEAAFVIRYGKHDSWGGRYANWDWNDKPKRTLIPSDDPDAEPEHYEGIAFWAKAGQTSDRFMYILLDDATTASGHGCVDPVVNVESPELQPSVVVTVVSADPNVDTSTNAPQESIPAPNHCNNQFRQLLQVSGNWELHLLPFDQFFQAAYPNRQPQGLGDDLYRLSFEFARGSSMELWIDQVMFYRRRPDSSDD